MKEDVTVTVTVLGATRGIAAPRAVLTQRRVHRNAWMEIDGRLVLMAAGTASMVHHKRRGSGSWAPNHTGFHPTHHWMPDACRLSPVRLSSHFTDIIVYAKYL